MRVGTVMTMRPSPKVCPKRREDRRSLDKVLENFLAEDDILVAREPLTDSVEVTRDKLWHKAGFYGTVALPVQDFLGIVDIDDLGGPRRPGLPRGKNRHSPDRCRGSSAPGRAPAERDIHSWIMLQVEGASRGYVTESRDLSRTER